MLQLLNRARVVPRRWRRPLVERLEDRSLLAAGVFDDVAAAPAEQEFVIAEHQEPPPYFCVSLPDGRVEGAEEPTVEDGHICLETSELDPEIVDALMEIIELQQEDPDGEMPDEEMMGEGEAPPEDPPVLFDPNIAAVLGISQPFVGPLQASIPAPRFVGPLPPPPTSNLLFGPVPERAPLFSGGDFTPYRSSGPILDFELPERKEEPEEESREPFLDPMPEPEAGGDRERRDEPEELPEARPRGDLLDDESDKDDVLKGEKEGDDEEGALAEESADQGEDGDAPEEQRPGQRLESDNTPGTPEPPKSPEKAKEAA